MSLDDATKAFIAKAMANPAPPPGSMPLADFRAAVEPFRALGFGEEPVARLDDHLIERDGAPSVPVRVYRPSSEESLPAVVWAHGGSWVRVGVDLLENHFRVQANRSGCVVVAVDYRLAPETPFPGALEDVYDTAVWVKRNADALAIDPTRIAIGGESSGGNLAAAAALLDRRRQAVGFALQALIVPVLDTTFSSKSWQTLGEDYLLTRQQLEWAVEQYAPGVDRTDELLSPLFADSLEGSPPALVVTGEYDPLRDEGERFTARLREAGVSVEYRCVPGMIHHAVMAPKILEQGRGLVEDSARFIGSTLLSAAS